MTAPQILDRFGRPIERAVLTREIAAATVGGVRSPLSGYPGDGLNPVRLAGILREADAGDPIRMFELMETFEERDNHILGILGTRRRSVTQLDFTVEAATDAAEDEAAAQEARDWLKRDELQEEMFDILDCIGKGVSRTEIIWDASEGHWSPARLEWRDPRRFRVARHDLRTPLMLDETGQEKPLPGGKFILGEIKAKSGLPLRGGLGRALAWTYLFKAFTQRDWTIFTQTYGHPLRVGKYGAGATEADKSTLFRAVANIAGDMAAIIPESMMMDFVETASAGATSDLYLKRCDWLDQQDSKAVLGQTATTDAVTGGLGSGKEHRQVQEDIERADAKPLSAILNRDLVRPWMALNGIPADRCPRLVLARPEMEDTVALAQTAETAARLGLRVSKSALVKRLGLEEAKDDKDVLTLETPKTTPPAPPAGELDPDRRRRADRGRPRHAALAGTRGTRPDALRRGGRGTGDPRPLPRQRRLVPGLGHPLPLSAARPHRRHPGRRHPDGDLCRRQPPRPDAGRLSGRLRPVSRRPDRLELPDCAGAARAAPGRPGRDRQRRWRDDDRGHPGNPRGRHRIDAGHGDPPALPGALPAGVLRSRSEPPRPDRGGVLRPDADAGGP